MTTLDSSAVIALFDPDEEEQHAHAAEIVLREDVNVLPAATLGEITYFVELRHGHRQLVRFIDQLIAGAFEVDHGNNDYRRVNELVKRYQDLPLGFVDAAVIACAERNGGRVLTYDYRHFGAVAREGTITLVR